MEATLQGADVFFVLIGAILVFAMHAGFAFLEIGLFDQFPEQRDRGFDTG